jgi:Domain of unknown function (DUF1906)
VHVIVSRRGQHNRQGLTGVGLVFAGCALVFAAAFAILAGPAAAVSSHHANRKSKLKTVRYRGYSMRVPASWPVYRLRRRPTVCVRFNRHAVYLGTPGSRQSCPASAAGRTEAILASRHQTHGAAAPAAAHPLAAVIAGGAQPAGGSEAQIAIPAHGVEVTATWNAHPEVVRRALGRSLSPAARTPASAASARVAASAPTSTARTARLAGALEFRPLARPAQVPGTTGTLFTGLGFDACTAPSASQMTAWGASPYRAIGVYIGGTNMACSQGNLTSSWVAREWAAGWHLMPIYVGLQAPGNSCGCSPISTSTTQATNQGTAAAIDAVVQAQTIGIGPGNPIYDDMEGYSNAGSTSAAVLAFLSAWTTELHAEGYGSGVYSSADSGIVDLAKQYGTTYEEPDDIWIARWNGAKNTNDPNVPSADWTAGHRIHQYQGDNDETFGGVKLDIDNDYLNGATAFGTPGPAPPPSLKVSSASDGTITLTASWPGGAGVTAWRTLGGSDPAAMPAITRTRVKGSTTTITLHSAFPFYAVQALGAGGQVLAASATVSASPHLALYGRSVFVPSKGLVGVPAGCFTGSLCRVALTVSAGRRVLIRTGRERLATSAGLVYFKMSSNARTMLAGARGHRLPVTVQAHDVSNASASATMKLVPFVTTGSGPRRGSTPAKTETVGLIGSRAFVFRNGSGGILASCTGPAPCPIKTKITAGGKTIASTGAESIGANEARYLTFGLTPAGRTMLARARGNQLGARVTLASGSVVTRAAIALTSYS